MSIPLEKSEINTIRTALTIGGVLSVIVGILILAWPGKTAMVVVAIVAIYAIASGLAYAGLGIFSRHKGGWARAGHILLGLVFIVAGVIAFTRLGETALVLATFLGILVGIMWIIEGVVSLSTLGDATSKAWTIFFAILSIVAGVVLLFSPTFGIAVLWWLLGISAVVLGALNIVRAFTLPGRVKVEASSYAPTGATNGLAIAAIVSVWFVAPLGLILGYVSLGQIARTNESGRGLALAAVVVGWIVIGLLVLIAIVYGLLVGSLLTR